MTKKQIVENYLKMHENATVEDLKRDLKISEPTAEKYIEFFRKPRIQNKQNDNAQKSVDNMVNEKINTGQIPETENKDVGKIEIETQNVPSNPEIKNAYENMLSGTGKFEGGGEAETEFETSKPSLDLDVSDILVSVLNGKFQSMGKPVLSSSEVERINNSFHEFSEINNITPKNPRITSLINLLISVISPVILRVNIFGGLFKKKEKIEKIEKPEKIENSEKTEEVSEYQKAIERYQQKISEMQK